MHLPVELLKKAGTLIQYGEDADERYNTMWRQHQQQQTNKHFNLVLFFKQKAHSQYTQLWQIIFQSINSLYIIQ